MKSYSLLHEGLVKLQELVPVQSLNLLCRLETPRRALEQGACYDAPWDVHTGMGDMALVHQAPNLVQVYPPPIAHRL